MSLIDGSKDQSSQFGISQWVNQSSSFTVQNQGFKNRSSKFGVSQWANQSSSLTVRNKGYKQASASFTVLHVYEKSKLVKGEIQLAVVIIPPGQNPPYLDSDGQPLVEGAVIIIQNPYGQAVPE